MLLKLTERYPLLSFFVLSYLFSWTMWGLERRFWPGSWLSWGGLYGPALAASLLAAVNGGGDGLRELLARLFIWRVAVKSYLVAILLIPVAASVVVAAYALTGGLTASRPHPTPHYHYGRLWRHYGHLWCERLCRPPSERGREQNERKGRCASFVLSTAKASSGISR